MYFYSGLESRELRSCWLLPTKNSTYLSGQTRGPDGVMYNVISIQNTAFMYLLVFKNDIIVKNNHSFADFKVYYMPVVADIQN